MTAFLHNSRSTFFAGMPRSKFSLLRNAKRNAIKRKLTIGNTRTNAKTRNIVNPFRAPLLVTTSHAQAKLATERNSVTSLNPQVRAVNV